MTISSESKRRVQIANRIDEVIALLDSAKMGCYSNDEGRTRHNVQTASMLLLELKADAFGRAEGFKPVVANGEETKG